MYEEEGQQQGDGRDDEICLLAPSLELIRDWPMYSPQRSPTEWCADQVLEFSVQWEWASAPMYSPQRSPTLWCFDQEQFPDQPHQRESTSHRRCTGIRITISSDELRKHFGRTRKAAAMKLGGMENQNDKPTNSCKGGKTKEKGVDASRKTWVQKEELALLNALKEMVVARGEKMGKDSFKAGYLKKLEGMLVVALPGTDIRAYPHISSKIKVWKKNYHSIKDMCNTSGFGWNDSKKMVEVDSDSVWEDYCKKDSNANGLRYKSFPYYEDWCIIFGNDRATGEMAESAADMVEAIDIEGDADEDGDGSTTVNKNDKSPQDPPKKKAKVSETLMAGLSNFADKLVSSLESSNATLEKVGARMGYAHDLSAKRGAVNAELAKLPISTVDRVKAGLGITKDAQTVDHFFSLKTEEEKLILVQTILECGF